MRRGDGERPFRSCDSGADDDAMQPGRADREQHSASERDASRIRRLRELGHSAVDRGSRGVARAHPELRRQRRCEYKRCDKAHQFGVTGVF